MPQSRRNVQLYSESQPSYRIKCSCSLAISFKRLSYYSLWNYSCFLAEDSLLLLDYLFLNEISSKKNFSRFDQYFKTFRFYYSLLDYPLICYLEYSLQMIGFLVVPCYLSSSYGLQKVIDLFKIGFIGTRAQACDFEETFYSGRLLLMDLIIYAINFYKCFEMGAIQERLNAPIILIIYLIFTSLLFFLQSFTYSYKHVEIIENAFNFYFTPSPISMTDLLRLVVVELCFAFGSSTLFFKLITLVTFFVILPLIESFLCRWEAENLERVRCIELAFGLIAQFLKIIGDYRQSVLRR